MLADPTTFAMPEEYDQLGGLTLEEPGSLWMAKPSGSKNGLGIKVLRDPTEAPKMKGILVQQYVAPPFTVDGLKFVKPSFFIIICCLILGFC